MHLQTLIVFLAVLVSAICVITTYAEDVDRHDIHRIILKPEKSKKHKKRTKAPKTKPHHRPHHVNSFEDGSYEHTADESITRYRTHQERPHYTNHRDEYHDLVKPKPPRHETPAPYSYPEEEPPHYEDTLTSAQQQNYAPYLQNSGGQLNTNVDTQADVFVDWNPIPSTQLTTQHDNGYLPQGYDQHSAATAAHGKGAGGKPTQRNKRKKTRRVTSTTRSPVISLTSTTTYSPPYSRVTFTTLTPTKPTTTTAPPTARPLTFRDNFSFSGANPLPQVMPSKSKAPLHQQHHYVSYNHNNKSLVKYEVSGSARPKQVRYTQTQTHINPQQPAPSIVQPVYVHNRNPQPVDNSYEIVEKTKDYNKQIKQTSGFKSTHVPKPIYPQVQPFLPTVSTYTFTPKIPLTSIKPSTQLEFGQRKMMPSGFTPNQGFNKLYLGLQ